MIRCHTITASALLTLLAPQFAVAQGDATRGGRMWDRWWVETHDAAPKGTHPLYPSTGRHAGPDSFRCNECHGWDYKGAEGNYSAGSHYTGIGGVLNSTTSPDDVFDLTVMQTQKPKTYMYERALEACGFAPEECVMIGDDWKDIDGANGVGMDTIYIARNKQRLIDDGKVVPNHTVENGDFDSLTELLI